MIGVFYGVGCIVAAFAVIWIAAKVDAHNQRRGGRDVGDWVINLASRLFVMGVLLIAIGGIAEILNRAVS